MDGGFNSIFQRKLPRQLYLKYDTNYFSINQLNEGLRDCITHMEVEDMSKTPKKGKFETNSFQLSEERDSQKKVSVSTPQRKQNLERKLKEILHAGVPKSVPTVEKTILPVTVIHTAL